MSLTQGRIRSRLSFLELRRRGCSLAYVQTAAGHEVDFLAELSDGSRELVQVAADLTAVETREREIRALGEAMAELDIENARIVTLGDAETVDIGGRPVAVVPAWRWLLEGHERGLAP